MIKNRLRLPEAITFAQDMRATILKDAKDKRVRAFGVLASAIALAIVCFLNHRAIFSIILIITGIVLFFVVGKKDPSRVKRIDFLSLFLSKLPDELMPRSSVTLEFDPHSIGHSKNLHRTGRTRSGKTKKYYRQCWLKLSFVLPDHTTMQVSFLDAMKTKAGGRYPVACTLALKMKPSVLMDQPLSIEHLPDRYGASIENGVLRFKFVQKNYDSNDIITVLGDALKALYGHKQTNN